MPHTDRYPALDALRGIAAVTVLISHLTNYGLANNPDLWAILKWTPLRVFWGGHQAVVLFFVLSGFSLFLLCEKTRPPSDYVRYGCSRFLRLYPVYITSLALTWLALEVVGSLPETVPVRDIVGHVGLMGTYDFNLLNPPIWSLIHEMRISLLFPLFFLATRRFPAVSVVVMTGVSLLLTAVLWTDNALARNLLHGPLQSYFLTVHYATMFVYGAALARYRTTAHVMARKLASASLLHLAAFIGVAMALYMYPFDNPWNAGHRMAGDIVISLGAVALIVIGFAFPQWLVRRPFLFLGRISFSLYLTHFAVMKSMEAIPIIGTNTILMWTSTIVLSLLVATVFATCIEKPSLAASRWVRRTRGTG